MKVKEESEKVGLKLNIQKTKIMASGPITSWQIDGETMETVTDIFGGCSKIRASLVAQPGKETPCNVGDLGSIPGLGRSPGEGKSYPLQYSGLENSMDCIVHGVTESQTRLSDFLFPKSLQMVIAAMKLKDICSLEEKL